MGLATLMRRPSCAALVLLLAACNAEEDGFLQDGNNIFPPGGGGSGDGDGDGDGTNNGDGDGDGSGDGDGNWNGNGNGNGNGNPDPIPQTSGLPCDVRQVLKTACWTCHGETPEGAPMSLTSFDDWHADAVSDGTRAAYELAKERIHDSERPMPPPARPQLTDEELATLDAWLNAGAPRSSESCGGDVIVGDGDGDGDGPVVDPDECELVFEARAHQGQTPGDTEPYRVQPGEGYECFYFTVPWDKKHQALDVEPIIDNGKVLHHWLLYQEDGTGEGDGSHARCVGLHPNMTLLSGWAPGNQGPPLPEDVGLWTPTGPNARFNLEIHYYNSGSQVEQDRSGARICATSKLRPKEAAQHWLGTEGIFLLPGREGTAGSTCAPTQEAHIISVSPHMHKLGRHMTTEIIRANGKREMLNDLPFAFDDQQIYGVEGGEVVIRPGDKLTTTCTFDNNTSGIVTFGPSTEQEMCYNFVTAWPVGSLGTGGGLGVSKASQTCMR